MTPPAEVRIAEWCPTVEQEESEIDMLADVLHAVVHAGAGISFIVPFSMDDARAFWRDKVLPAVRARTRYVVVAWLHERIVGTVQLDLATPPNQPHRADVAKMLVHPIARRRGIARLMMIALEEIARREKRSLLTLDTVTGGPAETLYKSLGFIEVGVIPRYARTSLTTDMDDTTILYKELVDNG
jgi:GNAT superfamily N-acetyltransferase